MNVCYDQNCDKSSITRLRLVLARDKHQSHVQAGCNSHNDHLGYGHSLCKGRSDLLKCDRRLRTRSSVYFRGKRLYRRLDNGPKSCGLSRCIFRSACMRDGRFRRSVHMSCSHSSEWYNHRHYGSDSSGQNDDGQFRRTCCSDQRQHGQ
jgi:hypothetical protein